LWRREKENQALEEASGDEKEERYGRNRWVDLTMVVTTMIIKVDASEEEIICLNTLLVFFLLN
jgi:hypothetical protein